MYKISYDTVDDYPEQTVEVINQEKNKTIINKGDIINLLTYNPVYLFSYVPGSQISETRKRFDKIIIVIENDHLCLTLLDEDNVIVERHPFSSYYGSGVLAFGGTYYVQFLEMMGDGRYFIEYGFNQSKKQAFMYLQKKKNMKKNSIDFRIW